MDDLSRIHELKNKKFIFSSDDVFASDLLLKDEDGKTFFEYLIDNDISIYKDEIIKYISNNYDLLKYTVSRGYELNKYYNIDLLFQKRDGISLIEELFKNKANLFKSLSLDIINRLFISNSGEYLIEKFLKENFDSSSILIGRVNDFDTLYNCFSRINRIDLMKYANDRCLLSTTPNGVTMIQELINMNVDLKEMGNSNSEEIAKILFENGKYDALLNLDVQMLTDYPNRTNSYLSMLIEKYKKGENIPFANASIKSINNKSIATANILLTKNGINYKKPNRFDLINEFYFDFSSKPVIMYMLEMDKDLTIQNFITGTDMESRIKKYIMNTCKLKEEDLKDFNINNIFDYLPSKERLMKEIKENGKKVITKADIYLDDLLVPMENGTTLLEYAIKNGIDISAFNYSFGNNLEAILKLIDCNYDLTRVAINEKLLYKDIGDNKKLIDLLMEKRLFSTIYSKDLRLMDYCLKYDCFKIISNEIMEKLFAEFDGKFLAEEYLNNDKFASLSSIRMVDSSKRLKLYEKGYKKIMINASEELLLSEYNGITILEDLLKSGISPTFFGYDFQSLKTMNILVKNNRPDLLYNAKLELLMNYPSKENNYMQYLITCCKNGINVNLEKRYNDKSDSKELLARCYIQMAKNNLLTYMEELREGDLLSKDESGKNLLFYLIGLDKEVTLNKILSSDVKRKPYVFSELKLLGVSDIPFYVKYDKFDCSDIYTKLCNDEYDEHQESPSEDLLNELRDLFMNDGKSDRELVEALITSYRYNTSSNIIFINELERLIEIKKKHPEFCYTKEESSGYFSGKKGVVMDSPVISTINHETGHALHYFLTNYEIPLEYEEVVSSIRNDPTWIGRVNEYSQRFQELCESVNNKASLIISKYISSTSLQGNSKEITELLAKTREEQKKMYLDKGYSEETISIILAEPFTLEEFAEQKKKIEIGELKDVIMRYDYDGFIAIGDIIDAISGGRFRGGILKNDDNEEIKSAYGHGVRYYSRENNGFEEMIANYASIIKSKKGDETIKLLRYYVGDELVDMLDNFYMNKIIQLPTYQNLRGVK